MLRLLSRQRGERAAAERIYAACMEAARRPELYRAGGIPDTLQGRFEAAALHLFPVLYRLMHVPGDDPALARRIAESLVEHMDATFREMGVGDTAVPKRMATLYQSFAGRLEAYKAGLEAEGGELGAAIARNVFPEGGDAGHAAVLAEYVRAASVAMPAVPMAELRRGALHFPPLPASAAAGDRA